MRQASIQRKTAETDIQVSINLDGTGVYSISTGIGFLDHMLEQLSRHSLIDIDINAKGDLEVDFHHTTEDTGISLGQAVAIDWTNRSDNPWDPGQPWGAAIQFNGNPNPAANDQDTYGDHYITSTAVNNTRIVTRCSDSDLFTDFVTLD